MNNQKFDSDFIKHQIEYLENKNSNNQQKFIEYFDILKQIISQILVEEKQFFSNYYTKLIYASDKFKFPKVLKKLLIDLNRVNKLINKKSFLPEEQHIDSIKYAIKALLSFVSDKKSPELKQIELFEEVSPKDESFVEEITLYAQKKLGNSNTTATLMCIDENGQEVKLDLHNNWIFVYDLVWKNAKINLFNVKTFHRKHTHYSTIGQSLVVLEPDYLVDATEIADCFDSKGQNINLYFLKKYVQSESSFPLLLGSIINNVFDKLIFDPNIDFDKILKDSYSQMPLKLFWVYLNEKEMLSGVRGKIATHYENLKIAINQLDIGGYSVEPSFMAPKYGLQGRLDLLIEDKDDPNYKTIVELKSGKAPKKEIYYKTEDEKYIDSSIWQNNLAQITCYNLMLDSAFENRTGSSQVLYSVTNEKPIRNAPNIIFEKQKVISIRNWIIAYERAIEKGVYSLFDSLNIEQFGIFPKFMNEKIKFFSETWQNSSILEKDYFCELSKFISGELFATKLGTGDSLNRPSQSSIWNSEIKDKENFFSIAPEMSLITKKSDLNTFYLYFSFSKSYKYKINFRKGENVILWKNELESPTKDQIYKGVIKSIDNTGILLSLRNKSTDLKKFPDASLWNIEADHLDSSTKKQFSKLFDFLSAKSSEKDLLLGIKEPEIDTIKVDKNKFGFLNAIQLELLEKAISAKDYFLIQGPPGTGKTSFMLKSIAEFYFKYTKNNILFLAYTNRAVDEICNALLHIENAEIIRLGNKESSEHSNILLSKLVESKPLKDVFNQVIKMRLFAATSSFVNANPELIKIKKFDLVVIDEGSQILESQLIGILSKIEKFIMIGDEKQLPAITVQNRNNLHTQSNNLKNIGLTNLADSLFDRLLRNSKSKKWHHCYGMLKHQARMHDDIHKFVNKEFYSNKLQSLGLPWQTEEPRIYTGDLLIEQYFRKNRMIFVNTKNEYKPKINHSEAKTAVDITMFIVNKYDKLFDENLIGIITPFRAQAAEIIRLLPEKIRDKITVDTVERFQGSERKYIIYSTAINNQMYLESVSSPYIADGKQIDRKLNVTITRAKEHFIILGNIAILNKSLFYRNLIEFIDKHNGIIDQSKLTF